MNVKYDYVGRWAKTKICDSMLEIVLYIIINQDKIKTSYVLLLYYVK